MSNTQKTTEKQSRWKHLSKFLAIHAGILLLMETDIAMTTASVLHENKVLAPVAAVTTDKLRTESVIKAAGTLHHAAESGVGMLITSQLITSILFVVLGFFLHVLWVSHRNNGERPVHVSVKKGAKKEPTWFWMEMRI